MLKLIELYVALGGTHDVNEMVILSSPALMYLTCFSQQSKYHFPIIIDTFDIVKSILLLLELGLISTAML